MFTIIKQFSFEAAHSLPGHDGKCARLHGHSFSFEVELNYHKLIKRGPKVGMAVDYGDVSAAVTPIIEAHLDHHYLNESLNMKHPTSENIAMWLFGQIRKELNKLTAVTVHETCTSACRYMK